MVAGTSFQGADLSRVCWNKASGIHLARFSQTILRERRVEILLVRGQTTNAAGMDLRGANLDGFDLRGLSFLHTDLTGASLRGTNLEGANLAETMCIGADFTGARLTGACLEAWNIDATTVLHEVDCRYVFLREHPNERGDRERRPHDPDAVFEPGDFTKLYQQVMSTMEILLRQGVTREALGHAFADLMRVHPEITPESVQSLERKGTDILLRMNVPAGVDKGHVEATLQSSLREMELLKAHNQTLTSIAMAALAGGGASIVVGGNIVGKEERSIKARDITIDNSGTFSLSGDVHHMVQSLAGSDHQEVRKMGELLAELEKRLATAPGLTSDDKALASEKVTEIAKAVAASPPEGALRKAGRAALLTLKGLAGALPDVAKIIEAVGKAMDAIGKLG